MSIEEASALISPIIPLHRSVDADEGDWMRAFALARVLVLSVAFCALPIALAVAPQTSASNLCVFLASVLSATLGLVALMHVGPVAALAASYLGFGILAAGPWFESADVTVAGFAFLALLCDVSAAPKSFRTRRWLVPLMAVVPLAVAAGSFMAEPADIAIGAIAAFLLPVAPIATLAFTSSLARRRLEAAVSADMAHGHSDEIMLAAADVAVLVTDRGGHIVDATPSGEALLGGAKATLFGRGLIDRVLIVDRPALLKAVSQAVIENTRTDCAVRLSLPSVPGEKIAPPRFALFDLTIRPVQGQAERATIRISRAAESDVPALGHGPLMQALAHEIRTPMNAILGFSEILGDPKIAPASAEQVSDYARIIHRSAREAFAVTCALIDLVRIGNASYDVQREPVDLRELLGAAVASVSDRLPAGVAEVSITGDVACAEIDADPRLCRTMFASLLEGMAAGIPLATEISCTFADRRGDLELVIKAIAPAAGRMMAHGGAHFGVVEALCQQIAHLSGAEFQFETTAAMSKAVILFRKGLDAPMSIAPQNFTQSAQILPLRKSA